MPMLRLETWEGFKLWKEGWLHEEALNPCSGLLMENLGRLGHLSLDCELLLSCKFKGLGLHSLDLAKGSQSSQDCEASLSCEDLALLGTQKPLLTSRAVEKSWKRGWIDEEDVFLLPFGFNNVDVLLNCRFLALLVLRFIGIWFLGRILLFPLEEFPFENTGWRSDEDNSFARGSVELELSDFLVPAVLLKVLGIMTLSCA